MNKTLGIGLAVAVLAAAAAGYWAGSHRAGGTATASAPSAPATGGKAILYYRNPMGLPDTSPVPKKDSMGMDYIPVFAGEDGDGAGSGLKISTEKVQKLGVRTEAVVRRELGRVIRATGRIEPDERRLHTVAPRFEGWVETLHVNVTGQQVGRGQPLFEVYSPELVSAQREYQVAAKGLAALKDAAPEAQAGMKQLADAALARLRHWEISDEQVAALAAGGEVRRTLTLRSPAAGVVLEKKALPGMRFMPGEALFQIGDLGALWVVADVFERDLGAVRQGAKATVRVNAFPDRAFEGRIAYVYPTLKAETRTVPVRVELANPGGLLKPAMFAAVEVGAGGTAPVLAVPLSAVIDGGARQTVLVRRDGGRFEPREVRLGARGDDHVEVREGLAEGEQVVVAANFLIDSESNLRAALGGMKEPGEKSGDKGGVGHRATGTLDAIDARAGTVTVTHEPVPSLKWPAMTMDFVPANPALVDKIRPGTAIAFEFVERKPGEWVITRLEKR